MSLKAGLLFVVKVLVEVCGDEGFLTAEHAEGEGGGGGVDVDELLAF